LHQSVVTFLARLRWKPERIQDDSDPWRGSGVPSATVQEQEPGMAQQKHPIDPETRKEAENLAHEAVEELKQGHKDEARFIIEEARHLDKATADEVMHEDKAPKRKPPAG
jgi:hypothetical protein